MLISLARWPAERSSLGFLPMPNGCDAVTACALYAVSTMHLSRQRANATGTVLRVLISRRSTYLVVVCFHCMQEDGHGRL